MLLTTAATLIDKLSKAHGEGRLEEKLKLYTAPRLLIVDEIGYLPIDRLGANLFFQLISRRYERGPMILTSNQSFGAWGEVFGDRVIATAILDRLLHHAVTMNIRGNSYRLKDKLKAGLVRPHDNDNASHPGGEINTTTTEENWGTLDTQTSPSARNESKLAVPLPPSSVGSMPNSRESPSCMERTDSPIWPRRPKVATVRCLGRPASSR